jgi:hypothetical protein
MPQDRSHYRYRIELARAGRPGLTAPAATEARARQILRRDAELAPAQVDYLITRAARAGGVQLGHPDEGFWIFVEC